MTTFIVLVSALLFLAGIWLIIAWGDKAIRPPGYVMPPNRKGARSSALRRYLWWANLWCFTALISGLLVASAGGRLVMRVLAETSPDSAQGRVTEAEGIVGVPSLGGTLGLLLFTGVPMGFIAALIYLAIYRLLPPGRLSGPLAGLLGLVLFGAFLEPFRTDNIDFAIVGPGWLSVLLFTTLAVLLGALVAAAAGWYSQRLPLASRRTLLAYLPLPITLLMTVFLLPAAFLILVGALVVMAWSAAVPPHHRRASPRYVWAGRTLLVLAVLLALPAFITSVVFIVSVRMGLQ